MDTPMDTLMDTRARCLTHKLWILINPHSSNELTYFEIAIDGVQHNVTGRIET
jgi:hypothetical protein